MKLSRKTLGLLAGTLLAVAGVAYATGISDSEIYLLNHMNSTAVKVKLGDLIKNAENGGLGDDSVTSAKILDGTIVTADIATGGVTTTNIANGTIVNADLDSGAAIAFAKLAALTNTHILVGSGAGVATDVAVSGDATLANTGALTIGAKKVGFAKIALTHNKVLIGDAGGAASEVTPAGDVTIDDTGATAIGSSKVTSAMIVDATVVNGDVADDTLLVGKLNSTVMKEATGTVTSAQLLALNATPVQLIAAPGAGKLIVVDEIEWFHDYATAVYTGGGDVTIEYATSGLDVEVFDVALITASADDNWIFKTGNAAPFTTSASTASHSSVTTSINKALMITCASADFGGGNASNILKYRIRYHVATVLT